MKSQAGSIASPNRNYGCIDVLRGVSACMVIVFHAMHVSGRANFPASGIWHFFDSGWVGVNIFLLISGLVITLSVFRNMERYGATFRGPFVVARLARIVPLYLLTGAVSMAVFVPPWLHGPVSELLLQIGSHLAFVHNLQVRTHGSIDGPNWSIGLEMQFYLLMVLIAPWLARRAGALHLAGALILAALFRYATTRMVVPGEIHMQFVYATQLPGLFDHFALGMALAFALSASHRSAFGRLQASWRRFLVWVAVSMTVLACAAFLLAVFGYWENVWMVTFLPSVLATGFMALLAAAITFPWADRRAIVPLRYLGEISYGLYLWHMPVVVFTLHTAPDLRGPPFLAAVFGLTFLLAALSWHLLEKPVSGFFRARVARSDHPGNVRLAASQSP